MRQGGLKIRVLLPLTAALIVLLGAFVFRVYRARSQEIARDLALSGEVLQDLVTTELEEDTALMRVTLECMAQDEELKAAFRARDRARLLALAEPRFDRMRNDHNITRLCFIEPDRASFLRVHDPTRYGDTIDRYTTLEAERTGETASGLELGELGTFALRVVAPWYDGDDLLGYVDLGTEFERVVDELRGVLDVDLYVVIDKRFLDRNRLERGMAMLGREFDWDRYPEHIALFDMPSHLEPLFERVLASGECPTRVAAAPDGPLLQFELNNAYYAGCVTCLKDARGREVGDMLMLRDVTGPFVATRSSAMAAAMACLAVGSVLFAVFYWILDRIERRLARELSERQNAEQSLRAMSARYKAILAAVPDVIAEVDVNNVYRWTNQAGRDFFGDDVVGQKAAAYLVGHQDTYERIAPLFGGREGIVYVESWQRRTDGQRRLLASWCRALGDSEGKVTGVLCTARDITDQKSNEEQLREGNAMMVEALCREKRIAIQLEAAMQQLTAAVETARAATEAKSAFLANMSHEIRTPMTAILGFAESLLDPDLSPSAKLDAINTIRRNGVFLLRIINDILDLSKIEAGKLEIERTPCSLCQLVMETQSLMQVRAAVKGLSLGLELDGPVPEIIETDPTRLRQVLINLIGNAIKFTESGHVRLVLRWLDVGLQSSKSDTERNMQFDIVDTGVGMTPGQLERVFEPFSQADTSTTRRYGGTGLGLAISKRLAIMLGGDIAVESKPGAGSTFRLTIAAGVCDGVKLTKHLDASIEGESASIDVPTEAAAPRELVRLGCRILLAEDGPDNQRLISFVLTRAGAVVAVADNGQLALERVQAAEAAGEPFDVILMDMQMPVMDGYEATRRLRERGYRGPIVALTAHAMAGDRDKCLAAGCDEYATKPIERNVLIGMIQRSIENRANAANCS